MPVGGEEKARAFYRDILAMVEMPKPEELATREGCWFRSGSVQIHLGVENDFKPALKAHPAVRCREFHVLAAKLRRSGHEVVDDVLSPGVTRCFVHDPFGNRIELVQDASALA